MTSNAQIRRVQREGKLIRTKHLTVRVAASPRAHMRVGIIVPRFGQTAVARNLLKRRLREIVRLDVLPLALPLDVLVRAAEPAYRLEFARLREEVIELLRRAVAAAPTASA